MRQLITLLFSKKYSDEDFKCTDVFRKLTIISMVLSLSLLFTDEKSYAMFIPQMQIAPNLFEKKSPPPKTANMPRLQKSDDEIEEPPKPTDEQPGTGKEGVTLLGGNTTRNRSKSLAPIMLSVPIDQSIFNTESSSLSEVTAKDGKKSVVKSRKSIVEFDLPTAPNIFESRSLPLKTANMPRLQKSDDEIEEPPELTDGQSGMGKGGVTLWGGNTTRNRSESLAPIILSVPIDQSIFNTGSSSLSEVTAKDREKSVVKSRKSIVKFDLPMASDIFRGELPLFKIAVKRTKSINKSRGSVVEFDLPVASDIFGDGPPPYKIATKRTKSVGKSRESVVEFDLPMDSNHILGISSEEEENSEDESKEDADDNEAEEDTEDKEDETDNGEEDVGDEAKDDSGEEADSAEEEEDEETEKAKKSKKSKKKKSKKERDDEDEDDDEETEKAKKSKKSKKKKLKEERDDDEDDDDEEEGEEASPEKKKNKKSKTLESEEEDADDENSGDDEDSEIVSEGRKSRIVGSVTNYDDREVVRETVDYLMALGVIDESKLDGLAFGDTMHGVCMLCGRLRSVHVIGGQLEYGICTPCMKRRVRQLEEGSLIGGASPMTQMVNALSGRDGGDYDGDNHEYGSRGNYGDDYDGSDYGGRNGRGSGLSGILGNGVGNMLQKLASGAEGGNGAQMAPGVGAAAGAAGAGQMVLNASGQLVPLSMVSAAAPYGYVRDPSTGQMRPATSLAEGTSAAQAAAAAGAQMAPGAGAAAGAAGAGQMVLNASGQLVPLSMVSAAAPYGYVRDPSTGQMRPATSLAEGTSAAQAAAAAGAQMAPGAGAAAGAAGAGQMVLNASGQLVPLSMVSAAAPYGYVRDPSTGQMRPATSLAEGTSAAQAAAAAGAQMAPGAGAAAGAAGAGQMVLNASGQLVPLSMVSAAAPYGYVRDPSTGQMRPATSLAEGTSAAQAAAAAGAQMAPGAQGVAAMSQVANLAGALGQNGVGNSINSVANTVAQNSALINSAASGLGSLLSSIKKPSSTAVAGSGTSSATGTNTTTGAGTSTAGGNTAASSGSASSATGANAATGTLDLSKLPKDKRENIEKLRKLWSNLTDKLTAAKNSSDSALSKLNTAQNELKEEEEEAQKATGNQKKKAENKVKKLKKSVDSAQKQYDKQTKAYNTAKVAADTAKASLDAAEQAAASS